MKTNSLPFFYPESCFGPTFTQTTFHRFDLSEYATDWYTIGSASYLRSIPTACNAQPVQRDKEVH